MPDFGIFQTMEFAYRFGDAHRLYLNVTNRCTNRCSFCVRYRTAGLGNAILWGGDEPDGEALQRAVEAHGAMENIQEFVWCGFGEPTFRLDLMLAAAPWLRSRGARIRLNTNGHGSLIQGRDILPELSQAVDEVSISLNAPDSQRYFELCHPDAETLGMAPERIWEGMLSFLARAAGFFDNTQASVVGFLLGPEEVDQCRKLAESLGVRRFRVR